MKNIASNSSGINNFNTTKNENNEKKISSSNVETLDEPIILTFKRDLICYKLKMLLF